MLETNYYTLKNRSISVQSLIKSHLKHKYPIPYLNDLFSELDMIYSAFIEKYLVDENANKITNHELLIINKFINGTNQAILSLLSNASSVKTPNSITIPVREKLQEGIHKAVYVPELIWDVNYYIGEITQSYNRYVESIGLDLKLNTQLYRFGIPYFYQDDALMSGILGHELGHYFDLHYSLNISETLLAKFVNDADFIDALVPFVVSEGAFVKDIDMKREIVALFLTKHNLYFKNWVREFVADVLGVMIYGPASFFSAERLFQAGNINGSPTQQITSIASKSHPNNKLRCKIKIVTLEKLEYTTLPTTFVDEIQRSERVWDDCNEQYCEDIIIVSQQNGKNVGIKANKDCLKKMEDYLDLKLISIIDTCNEKLPENLMYQPEVMNNCIEELADKLGELLPPNELSCNYPSDSISIINAGWLVYFNPSELLKRQYNTNDRLLDAINSLLVRALEVASIHRRWLNVSAE